MLGIKPTRAKFGLLWFPNKLITTTSHLDNLRAVFIAYLLTSQRKLHNKIKKSSLLKTECA